MNCAESKPRYINAGRAFRKLLLVDADVYDLLFELEDFDNAEGIAIANGVIPAFAQFRESIFRSVGERHPNHYARILILRAKFPSEQAKTLPLMKRINAGRWAEMNVSWEKVK